MCDCITEMNTMLKPHNTRISVGIAFNTKAGTSRAYPVIDTEKIDKQDRKRKAVQPIPTYCPFCGERYVKSDVLAPAPTATDHAADAEAHAIQRRSARFMGLSNE
jgi:hypothetical protein